MAENEEKQGLIQEYLHRLKIQEKSSSFADYAERLAHLAALRDILERLNVRGYVSSEGAALLGAERQPLGTLRWGPPDFVVLREDVLIHVYLVVGPLGQLTATQLQGVWNDLRENSSLSAVAVCWPEKDYPSVVVDSFTIRNYLERPAPVSLSTEGMVPITDAINNFYGTQLVDWELSSTSLRFSSNQRMRELGADLLHKIQTIIESEKSRDYEIPEKVEALGLVSSGDIEELVRIITTMIAKEDTSNQRLQELEDLIENLSQH